MIPFDLFVKSNHHTFSREPSSSPSEVGEFIGPVIGRLLLSPAIRLPITIVDDG
jgi:hypothetical protein